MAIWTMIPDKVEEEETQIAKRFGVFWCNAITFFLAEMGDKTQIATVAMAAHYAASSMVVIGTTLGMLIADVPVVFVGDKLAADPNEAGSRDCSSHLRCAGHPDPDGGWLHVRTLRGTFMPIANSSRFLHNHDSVSVHEMMLRTSIDIHRCTGERSRIVEPKA